MHCHRNPFDLTDAPLVAPKIVYAKTNYKDASTQSSVNYNDVSTQSTVICKDASTQPPADQQEESGLTVLPEQTPVKRTREESATDLEEQPALKRHQSNPTESTTQTTARIPPPASANPSTRSAIQTSTRTESTNTTVDQSRSKSAPTTPKHTTMANITRAKSPGKAPQFSSLTRSQVGSMQITSEMTWGQMNLSYGRRARLRQKQIEAGQDHEAVDESSSQTSQTAPATPQTAPQAKSGIFGSLRKAFSFVPQLPASVTQMVSNPFSPARSTPAVESKQADSISTEDSTNSMQYNEVQPFSVPESTPMVDVDVDNSMQYGDVEQVSIPEASPRVNVDVDDSMITSPTPQQADDSPACILPPKRKAFTLDYDDSNFAYSDDSDEGDSAAPVAKKQRLDEAQPPRSVLKKRTGNGFGTMPRTNKHVTFDDSPVDTPSKVRGRAHEYNGIHFADAPKRSETSDSSDDELDLSNSPGTKANTEENTPFYYPPPEYPPLPADVVLPGDFTPTSSHPRPGTFCLDFNTYGENDEDSEFDTPIKITQSNNVVGEPDTSIAVQPSTSAVEELAATTSMVLPPATPRITHAELPTKTASPVGITIHSDVTAGQPSTTTITITTPPEVNVLTDVSQDQINRVRFTAEQHKSKNPSRLSQVEHVTSSSPPAEESYNEFDAGWPKSKSYVEAGICSQRVYDLATKGEHNEFDAGWPKSKSYVEAGICSQRIFDIVDKNWDARDDVIGEMVYEQDLKEWIDAHRLEKEQGVPVRYPWSADEEEEEL